MTKNIKPAKHRPTILSSLSIGILFAILSACASPNLTKQFDFGSASSIKSSQQPTLAAPLTIHLMDIQVPTSLESSAMLYRLHYENAQELKPYAQNRWSMPPAQLLKQRIKALINQQAGAVVSAGDGVKGLPIVRIELEEFSQHFSSPQQSQVHLRWRATLIKNNQLMGQKIISTQAACDSPDAQGGAKAMPIASDLAITELIQWLQTQLQ